MKLISMSERGVVPFIFVDLDLDASSRVSLAAHAARPSVVAIRHLLPRSVVNELERQVMFQRPRHVRVVRVVFILG